MKLVVFGASGGTGRALVSQALAAGHTVTAFVRNPESLAPADGLRIAVGDAGDAAAVAGAIAGQDAVLSALGARTLGKSDLLERASAHIVAGMEAHGVRRLIVLGAAGALHDARKHNPGLGNRLFFALIRNTFLKNAFADSAAQERRIEASALDYTIVHPPRLLDTPGVGTWRTEPDGLPPGGRQIAREDVARFMLAQLDDPRFVRGGPYIAY